MLVEILATLLLVFLLLQYFTQTRPANFPPGPTGVPILGYLPFIGTKVPEKLAELSKKYGQIFSVYFGNHPVIVVHDLAMIKEMFRDERFSGRPPLELTKSRSWGAQRGIVFSSGKSWSDQRRFTMRNLKDFGFGKGSMESLILDEVVDLIVELKKELNHPTYLDIKLNAAVLNSLWHVATGERYKHDDPKFKKVIRLISEEFAKLEVAGPLFFFEWFAKLFPDYSGYNRFLNTFQQTYEFLREHVEAHRSSIDPNHPRDLIDVYLNEIQATKDSSSSFYKEEGEKNLLVTLIDLFGAGSDTTAVTIGWAVLYLITNPNLQRKLQDEIDAIIGNNRLPSLSDRPHMPYLEAVITETLRCSSITPLGAFHSTTEPVQFHGYSLPKDTIIFPNYWYIHHDSKYWSPDPNNFRPERFITREGKFKGHEAIQAFSNGKRACLGESLARDELFLFLSGLLQQLNFEVDSTGPSPSLEPSPSVVSKPHPYKVVMTERESKSK